MAKFKCSWCGAEWQDKSKLPATLQGGDVSHGICKSCSKLMDAQLDTQVKQSKDIENAIRGIKL